MSNVATFPPTGNMTPEQALRLALDSSLSDAIVVGYGSDGELVVLSSKMDRKDALWLAELLRRHVLSDDQR